MFKKLIDQSYLMEIGVAIICIAACVYLIAPELFQFERAQPTATAAPGTVWELDPAAKQAVAERGLVIKEIGSVKNRYAGTQEDNQFIPRKSQPLRTRAEEAQMLSAGYTDHSSLPAAPLPPSEDWDIQELTPLDPFSAVIDDTEGSNEKGAGQNQDKNKQDKVDANAKENGGGREIFGQVQVERLIDIPQSPAPVPLIDFQDDLDYISDEQIDEFLASGRGTTEARTELEKIARRRAGTKTVDPPHLRSQPTWWLSEIQNSLLPTRQPQQINLDRVIWMALQQAPQIQVLNTEPEVQRTVINESIAQFDWSTFVDTVWTDTNLPTGDDLQTGSPGRFLQQEFSVEGGVTKLLANGGDIRIGQNFGRLDSNSSFLNPQDQGSSQLVIDYRQPLLRGAGRRFASTQIVLARLDFEQIHSQSLQGIQEYIVEVVTAYWSLYQARAVLVQTRRSFERAVGLLVRLKDREDIDVTNDQIFRAEAAAGSRKSDVIRAEFEVQNAQDVLVNLIVGPDSEQSNLLELIPEPMVLPEHAPYNSEALTYVALRNRPEISEAVARIKTGSTQQFIAANQLLPQLDAIISTQVAGIRGNFDAGGAFVDQFSQGDPTYSIGFGFELPIGNRAAKSRVERQQLQTRIFAQQFEQAVGDVVVDVRVTARNLDRLNLEMQNNLKALVKATQELEYIQTRQELLLDDGKTGSLYIEDLLASQSRLTEAERRLLESQVGHAVSIVDLKRATGELINAKFRADQFIHAGPTPLPTQAASPLTEPISTYANTQQPAHPVQFVQPTEHYSPEQYSQEQYSSEYSPQPLSSEQYTPEQYTPEQYTPEQYTPEQYAPEQYTSAQQFSTLPTYTVPDNSNTPEIDSEYYVPTGHSQLTPIEPNSFLPPVEAQSQPLSLEAPLSLESLPPQTGTRESIEPAYAQQFASTTESASTTEPWSVTDLAPAVPDYLPEDKLDFSTPVAPASISWDSSN